MSYHWMWSLLIGTKVTRKMNFKGIRNSMSALMVNKLELSLTGMAQCQQSFLYLSSFQQDLNLLIEEIQMVKYSKFLLINLPNHFYFWFYKAISENTHIISVDEYFSYMNEIDQWWIINDSASYENESGRLSFPGRFDS